MTSLKRVARRYYFKHILICTLINLMLFPLPIALANPNPADGTLPTTPTTPYGGVGSFDYSTGRLDIQNVSNGAVINWKKFDIGAGATTEFHQVNSGAYVLNRVSASDGLASGIKGNLTANGNIIVMNPRGIVIGPSALINAGKFVASGLGITDKNFRDFAGGTIGTLIFDSGCPSGNVTNNGTINAGQAVYLVGNSVTNTGTISCPGGMVVMAAGEKVYLAQSGSNVVIEKLDTGYDTDSHVVTSGGTINATGAGILLAAGDIYSQAVITGARSFVAQADRDIRIEAPIQTTGSIDIWADELEDTLGDVYTGVGAKITAGGNVTIRGNKIELYDAVKAGADELGNIIGNDKDLTITGRACLGGEPVWYDIYAHSTLDASRDIVISNTGMQETVTWVPSGKCGDGEWVYNTEYFPGTIYLYDDVTAGRDLSIYNNTYTSAGVTLRAGNNIILAEDGIEASALANCSWLRGTEWLALRAGNEIQAPRTVISVSGSTLIMEQGLSLNLDSYLFANQVNTDLTLISNHGSVTAVETGTKPANAADQWKSIGATADNGSDNAGNAIHLSGNHKDIVATELKAYHDDITVNAKTAKVRATENVTADTGSINLVANTDIEASKNLTAGSDISATAGNNILLKGNANAGQNINLTAVADVEAQGNLTAGQDVTISSSDTTTYLGGNVNAGNNVLLNNNTKLNGAGDQSITAQNGTAVAKGTLAKTTGGRMSILAADGIALSGAAASVDSMYLDADTDEDGTGDMLAQSTLTTTTGNIEISASDSTIKLQDNVSAGQDLILNNNTEVAAGKKLDAGRDVTVAANKTLKGKGALTVEADRHITLGGAVTASDEVDGDLVLWADKNADNDGDMTASGTISNPGGSIDIYSSDNTTYLGGDSVVAGDNVTLHNNTVLNGAGNQRIEATTGTLTASKNLDKTTAGNLNLAGQTGINLDGTVEVEAGSLTIENDFAAAGDLLASENVTLNGAATLDRTGDQSITAKNGTVLANGTVTKTTTGRMNVLAADGITFENAASAQDSMYLNADTDEDGVGDMWAKGTLTTTTGDIQISASDSTIKLEDNVSAGKDLILNNNTRVAADKSLNAGQDVSLAKGKTITGTGNLAIRAGRDVGLGGDVTAAGKLTISANPASNNSNVYAYGKLTSGNDMLVEAGDSVYLEATPDSAYAGGDMIITAGEFGDSVSGDLEVAGNLTAEGDITLSSSDYTTHLGGDVYAGHDITLNNNTIVNGYGDQTLEAGNKLTACGYVRKETSGDMYLVGNSEDLAVDLKYNGEGAGTSTSQGNLWILGRGDIQISGDVTTFGEYEYKTLKSEISVEGQTGGVAIISDEGKIYTEGGNNDTLNVSVTGSSDQMEGTGVYGFGPDIDGGVIEPAILAESGNTEAKAAIAIVSADELKLGEDARLTARGTYYDNVDDRSAIGFLDEDAEIPTGTPRNPGVPFDLAVYTASRNSSVTINCPVTITSEESQPPVPTIFSMGQYIEQQFVAKGAMAIDAYDIVSLGDKFRQSLANGEVGDRLEVCSRITEWLDDAVGRLPFPGDLDLPKGYSYVMRGAGLENAEITDGRAWVLESKEKPFTEAAPIQQQELKSTGCPALMNWVANELGVEKDQIQIYISGALALSDGVQPCDICAKLQNTALALKDADGAQIKALGQVINEFAGAGAPPSEEQMAMIATSLQNPKEGTQYALAAQWLNALAEYTSILHNDLKMPANESVARAAKYASPVVNGDNAALTAFVQAKLAGLGG